MEQIGTEETPKESAIEEALEGVYLASIAEEWKINEIEAIPEHQLQKIEGTYLLQEELKQILVHPLLDINTSKGIMENIPAGGYNPKAPSRKRGRKTTSQLLQELGAKLINEGKVKALVLTPSPYP